MSRPEQWLRTAPRFSDTDVGARAVTPHSAQVHAAGDFDLRWYGWLPHSEYWDSQRQPLITKGHWIGGTDNRAYHFAIQTNHNLTLSLSGQAGGTSTVAVPDWGTDPIALRVTRRQSDGRIQFFYSNDAGLTWTKLGVDITGGTSSIPNRGDIWINQDRFFAFTTLFGHCYWAEVRDGIDGTVIASPDFTENGPWSIGDDEDTNPSQVDSQGNTWTLTADSTAKAKITNNDSIQHVHMTDSESDISTPHSATIDDTGQNLQGHLIIQPDSWASGTRQTLMNKGSGGIGSWAFYLDGSGFLNFGLTSGGSGAATSSVPVPFSDGDWGIVGFDYDEGTGVVGFYAELWDPYGPLTTFDHLGTDQSEDTGGASNTDPLIVGRDPASTGIGFIGKLVQARLGFPGVNVVAADPMFRESGPWIDGDDSTTPAKNDDNDGNPWSLGGNADIETLNDQFFHGEGTLIIGEGFTEEKDLQSEATAGLVLSSDFKVNPRIVGNAEGRMILGSQFAVGVHQVGRVGLILDTGFEVIPPEITAGIGSTWSVGIAGRGYMLSTLDQEYPFEFRSYEIQAIPQQRPQIDDRDEPGEQTLFPWWSRAQHSWHEGAGQDIFDSPFSSRFRYCTSQGLDPWDEGELKFLKDTEVLRTDTVDDHHLLATPDALFYTANGVVHRDTDPDTAGTDSLTDHSGTPINSIASDGEYLYAAFSGGSLGIKRTPLAGALAWSDVNVQTAVEKIAVVKGRLIGAKGGNLYEYDLSVTTEPEPLNPPMPSTWEWTSIAESGPAIYFSGHAGDISEIFAVRLTAQDIPFSSVATLGAMRSIWQAPEGETVHTVRGFLGQQVLVGTSKGVRVGTIVTGEGDLEVSGLITEQKEEHPRALNVKAFEPQSEFGWFTWSNYDATRSGLGRVHLGELTWSSDLMHPIPGEVTTVVDYQDRRYFVIDEGAGSDSHIIKEHATDLVATAQLEICTIRFGTREVKQLRHFDTDGEGAGTYSLSISPDGKPAQPIVPAALIGTSHEHVVNIDGVRFKATINFTRDPSDATAQGIFKEWRIRSEPRSKGRFRYMVPLMIYDHVVNLADQEVGRVGYALENLEDLMELYRTGRDTLFQRVGTGVPGGPSPVLVTMEDLRFKTFTPPAGAKGFGGIALAILREVR